MHLSKELKRILIMSSSFNVIFNFISIFVNYYIWQTYHHISDICLYNIGMYCTWGMAFATGAKLLTRFSIRIPMRLSALSGALTFLLLILLHIHNHTLWILTIAAPTGLFGGFYYSGQNLGISMSGTGKEFGSFYFTQSLIGQIIALVNPILSALFIHFSGFLGSFILMFVFVSAMIYISFLVPCITLKEAIGNKALYKNFSWNKVFFEQAIRWMYTSILIGGVFFQLQATLATVLTFNVSGSAIWIAILNTSYTLACIIGLRIYRKLTIPNQKWLMIGILFVATGFILALFTQSIILVLSNFATCVGMFYFNSVYNAQQYQVLSNYPPYERTRIFVWREVTFCVSKSLILALIFPLHQLEGFAFAGLLAFALLCGFSIPFIQSRAFVPNPIRG